MPTDTLYGISCVALNEKAVERVYQLRKRDPNKPCIILIGEIDQIEMFGIGVFDRTRRFLEKIWPDEVSIIIPIKRKKQKEFEFLHRGKRSLAFRMPDLKCVQEIIAETGPLVSTSVNIQGHPPAKNIKEAKEYFGEEMDFYLDMGELVSVPSSLAEIDDRKLKILRKGKVDLEKVKYQ